MIPLTNPPTSGNKKTIYVRVCFILVLVFTIMSAALRAAPVSQPATRITYIVRADPHTGRLIRGAVRAPRVVPENIITAKPVSILMPNEEITPPGGFQEVVDRIAQQNQVEIDLVHSVIRAESNYNPYAVSPKGARGLMQLVPATARRFGVANSFNPAENVQGGVKYLKYLLDLYHDNYPLALAAYNAGEGAVDRYRGVPPYPETRNYVYRVGRNLGEAREARKRSRNPVQKETKTADGHRRIESFVDSSGKIHYRTE